MYAPKAMDALRRIVRGLRTTHAAARARSVSAAQLFVLREIHAAPGIGLVDVTRLTMTSASSASEVVTRLVDAGLVTRVVAPNDRRRVDLRVTLDGERVITGAPTTVQERLITGFRLLDERDQRELARTLEAWVSLSGLSSVPATMFFEPVEEVVSPDRTSMSGAR